MEVKNNDCNQTTSTSKSHCGLPANGLSLLANDANGIANLELDGQPSSGVSSPVNLDELFDAAFNVAVLEKYEREKEKFNDHNDSGKIVLIRKCLVPYMIPFFDKLTKGTLEIPDVQKQQMNLSLLRMDFEIMENNIKSSLANFMKKIQSPHTITQFGTMEVSRSQFSNQHSDIPDKSVLSNKICPTKTVTLTKMTGPEQVYGSPTKERESSSNECCQTLSKQCDCKIDYSKQSKNTYVRDSDSEDIKRLNQKVFSDQDVDVEHNLESKETFFSKSLHSNSSGLKLIRICRTEPDCSYVETGGHNMPRHVRNNHNNLRPEYDSRYVDSLVFEQMQRIWLEQQQRIQKKRFGKRNLKNQDYQRRNSKL